jgi:hypothetical protein
MVNFEFGYSLFIKVVLLICRTAFYDTRAKINNMNLKRIFGAILTLLGIGGLIYAAVVFSNTSGGTRDIKSLAIFGVLGLLFFVSGLSLVRTTKDET